MTNKPVAPAGTPPATQLAGFIGKFDPAIAKRVRAAAHGFVPLPTTGRGRTLIKSVSAKQRPRRPVTR